MQRVSGVAVRAKFDVCAAGLSARRRLVMLGGALCLVAGAAIAAEEPAQIKEQLGDWQMVCKTPEGAKGDICALVQDVTSDSNPNVQLSVQFQQGTDGNKVLRVFAPLGVLLPPGLGLQIDEQKVGHAPFVRCQVVGCVAQVTLPPELMSKFKAGKTAWFIIYQTKEAGIGIPVSLSGFASAVDKLQ
jgi:invasion protein IalB